MQQDQCGKVDIIDFVNMIKYLSGYMMDNCSFSGNE